MHSVKSATHTKYKWIHIVDVHTLSVNLSIGQNSSTVVYINIASQKSKSIILVKISCFKNQ